MTILTTEMAEDIVTTLKILIIGESGVGKSRYAVINCLIASNEFFRLIANVKFVVLEVETNL